MKHSARFKFDKNGHRSKYRVHSTQFLPSGLTAMNISLSTAIFRLTNFRVAAPHDLRKHFETRHYFVTFLYKTHSKMCKAHPANMQRLLFNVFENITQMRVISINVYLSLIFLAYDSKKLSMHISFNTVRFFLFHVYVNYSLHGAN